MTPTVERLLAEMVEHGWLVESVRPGSWTLGERPSDEFPLHRDFYDFLVEHPADLDEP